MLSAVARGRAEGVAAEPTAASLVDQCVGMSYFPQTEEREGKSLNESVVALLSFKASADQISSLGCGSPGPAELGQTVCKLI